MIERTASLNVWDRLAPQRQMVLISGPRQVGKTTLIEQFLPRSTQSVYINWDEPAHRRLLDQPYFYEYMGRIDASKPLIVLDEFHQYADWIPYLKDVYDRDSHAFKFAAASSVNLTAFQQGGAALAGRFDPLHLWPLTLGELANRGTAFMDYWRDPLKVLPERSEDEEVWRTLDRLSGFPEPFLHGTGDYYRNWSRTYRNRLLRDDLRDVAEIRKFAQVDQLYSLLPSGVGRPLSMHHLAGQVRVSSDTVKHWLEWFDQLFLSFRINPWYQSIPRAIRKEKKLYLFDYAALESAAARLENRVALELWRAVHQWNDLGLGEYTLHYLRNKQGEEADFLIARQGQPQLLLDVKSQQTEPDVGIRKFQTLLQVPAVHLVDTPGVCRLLTNGDQPFLVVSASRYLSMLP